MKKLFLLLILFSFLLAPAWSRAAIDCQQEALGAARAYFYGCIDGGGNAAFCSQQAHTVYCQAYHECAPQEPAPQGCQDQ